MTQPMRIGIPPDEGNTKAPGPASTSGTPLNPQDAAIESTLQLASTADTKEKEKEKKNTAGVDWKSPETILKLQYLISQTPREDERVPIYHQWLGGLFRQKYWEAGSLDDLQASVMNFQRVLDLTPEGDPDQSQRLQDLSRVLSDRYQRLGKLEDMQDSLQKAQMAVDLTPETDSARADRLLTVVECLRNCYKRLGNLQDLDAALHKNEEARALLPHGHPDQTEQLVTWAVLLMDRYQRLGELKDLEAAVQKNQVAVGSTPDQHPNRAERLENLATSLLNRYWRLGAIGDLGCSFQAIQEAVNVTPQDDTGYAHRLQILGAVLSNQFKRWGDVSDLEAALQTNQKALDLTPNEHLNRANVVENLAISLTYRYKRLSKLNDLQASVVHFETAADLTKKGDPSRPKRLQSLATALTIRYARLGDARDLEKALHARQEAVDLVPHDHSEQRAGHLEDLAMSHTERYTLAGDLSDLEVALQAHQEAVDMTPHDHPDRASRLHNLAVPIALRYRRLGDLKDLEAALQINQEAVDLNPPTHINQAIYLQSLAETLRARYQRLGDIKDLNASLQRKKEVVHLTPEEDSNRGYCLTSLAASFTDRFQRLEDVKDLDGALLALRHAMDLTPDSHPDRAHRLQTLGVSHLHRYEALGNMKDLESSVKMIHESVTRTPDSHPDRAHRLQDLAVSLICRYRRLRDSKDLEAIETCFTQSFESSSSLPEAAWNKLLYWASFTEEFQLSSQCIAAYRKIFALLPEILWIGNPIPVRQATIHRLDLPGATSRAVQACINLAEFHTMVEILEQGLATTFQQMLQLKTDVDLLPPDQASDFITLSSQLYSGTAAHPMQTVEKRQKLLQKIQQQPRFEYFLLPKSYNVLCHAAKGGPVIMLTSHSNHCDAMLMLNTSSEPVHVPLPTVTIQLLQAQRSALKHLLRRCNVRSRGQSASSRLFGHRQEFSHKPTEECFEDMLQWLWIHVVDPVYHALGSYGICDGRLWWLPTGAFTGLPFHATTSTDKFIHSYTTTLGALADAYSKTSCNAAPRLAIIGVPYTDSYRSNALPGVEAEVKKIISVVNKLEVRSLKGEQATVAAVKHELHNCSWLHLACHGYQDPVEPTKSHLQLYGGNLELGTILRMPLPDAQFVFLAACQTAMGDAQLVNESFHLGGGFITAGFRSAVGTMWSMNDQDGPTVAELLYSHIFREGNEPHANDAAEALQLAIKELRTRETPYERWVPFIHIGV
ncbi:CHAT domain-containing protein [Mycena polygramma]|nr:CHAT domain-containing protein [Mycena polygramma]